MMAYRPPRELKGRIENIRKKFEAASENCTVSTSNSLSKPINKYTVSCRKEAESLSGFNIPREQQTQNVSVRDVASDTAVNGNQFRCKYRRQDSNPPTKGNIRRTPAFRCEKNFRGRGSSRAAKKDNMFFDSKVKIFETDCDGSTKNAKDHTFVRENPLPEISHEKLKKDCIRTDSEEFVSKFSGVGLNSTEISKTDESQQCFNTVDTLIKQCECTVTHFQTLGSQVKFVSKPEKQLNKDPILHHTKNDPVQPSLFQDIKEIVNIADTLSISNLQGSVTGLSDKTTENTLSDSKKKECGNDLTNSLKAALKAPLPPGPPPKKPPRTFAHSPASKNKVQERVNQLNKNKVSPECSVVPSRPQRSRTEPHIMLKKLEEALVTQQEKGIAVITPRTPVVEKKKTEKTLGKVTPPQPPNSEVETSILTNCFNSLNCATNTNLLYSQTHLYEKPSDRSSKFFVEINSSCSKIWTEHKQYGTIKKSYSEEHIYAEPFSCEESSELHKGENAELNSKKQPKLIKSLSASVEQLNSTCRPVLHENSSDNLHYMCTPIKIDVPSSEDSEIVSKKSPPNNRNFDLHHRQHRSLFRKGVTEKIVPSRVEKPEGSSPSRKLPLLNIGRSVPNDPDTAFRSLDRGKIQLVMNQAFGSPLQGVTGAGDEAAADLFDDIASSPVVDDDDDAVGANQEDHANRNFVAAEDSQSDGSSPDLTRLTEERKVYLRRVSSRVFQSRPLSSGSGRNFPHLFHCVMLIGLNLDCEKKVKVPYIKSKYPPQAEVPPLLEHLCFPDAAEWPPPPAPRGEQQMYSLVITSENGNRTFGYCCRVMPEGAPVCLPLAYCIVSPHRARGFYYKVLHELESRHGQPEWLQAAFIKELYACEFPSPGQGLKCSTAGKPTDTGLVRSVAAALRRPMDSRLEDGDLSQLLTTLPVNLVLQVFATLLLERKVLFLSTSLSKLSSCIEALESVLYPFSWQYTFIPVLPSSKLEVCEAPTPYIIGVLKGKDGSSPTVNVDEGLLVDLDESRVCHSVGDESSILPSRLRRCLKVALQLAASQDCEASRSVLVSEAFLRMFVEVCGHYQTYIVTQQDGKKVFERESFIKAVTSRSVQMFLEWFTETAMFSVFLHARMEQSVDSKGLFEQRLSEHIEEMEKNTMLFLRNYKALNKKVKTLGDRLKDWAPFS